MKEVVVTTSWDDGHVLDTHVAELMKQYGLRGTFYVAPKNSELGAGECLNDEAVAKLAEVFEVGAHTMSHRELTKLTPVEVQNEIIESKEYLENITNKSVVSFCYPRGKYTKEISHIVRDLGFSNARTVERFCFTKSEDPFAVRTSVHTYNHWSDVFRMLVLTRFNILTFLRVWRHWDRLAILMFDRVRETGGVFHLWGHSWELEKNNDWKRLERVFQHIGKRSDVSYVTNGELYNE